MLADRSLHEQLRLTPDLDAFAALASRLAAQRDCAFTEQEMRAAFREARRRWLEKWI